LRRAGDFWDKLAYIHDNPVEAKLVRKASDWPWSSAAQYAGIENVQLTVDRFDWPADRNALLWPAPWR